MSKSNLHEKYLEPRGNSVVKVAGKIKNMRHGNTCLIALAWCLLSCSLHLKDDFVTPDRISYSEVQGFAPQKGSVIEWNSASTMNKDEPTITASLLAPSGLRIRWLGTAGYEISDDSIVILIDPFVSRPTFVQLMNKIEIDTSAVKRYILDPIKLQNIKVILVSHGHHDHFQDVPYILAQYPNPAERPLVVGSQNTHDLIMGYRKGVGIDWVETIGGLQNSHTKVLAFSSGKKSCLPKPGNIFCRVGTFGNFKISAFASDHSSYDYLGPTSIAGSVQKKSPERGIDYKMLFNTSIGYLIEYQSLRIFFTESPIVKHANRIDKVDILIQGIASRRDYNTILQTLAALQPKYVIPTHYDNFFKPLKELKNFDVRIGWGPVDFSRFEQFINSFESYYVGQAQNFQSKLRLMKLFYYYSLAKLL